MTLHFRDVFLSGPGDYVALAMDRLTELLTDGWSRDCVLEAEMSRVRQQLRTGDVIDLTNLPLCFSCVATANRPAVRLFMMRDDSGRMHVSNILPEEGQLAKRQYNAILREFAERFIVPAAEHIGSPVCVGRR